MWFPKPDHPLPRMFAGMTEHTFITTLGVTDTALIDYLSLLLSRFLHMDDVYRLHDTAGRPLVEVVDMVLEAERLPRAGRTAREFHVPVLLHFQHDTYNMRLENFHRILSIEAHARHIQFREESRYPGYYYRGDHDKIDDTNWKCFTNSVYVPETNTWTLKKVEYKQMFD